MASSFYGGSTSARPYTSMYSPAETGAATAHGNSLANGAPLNEDVRESMDFIARYCRGELTTSTPTPLDRANSNTGLARQSSLGYAASSLPQYPLPSPHPTSAPAPQYQQGSFTGGQSPGQLPSWAYRHATPTSTEPPGALSRENGLPSFSGGPGGRPRAVVGSESQLTPTPSGTTATWQHHSPVRSYPPIAPMTAGAAMATAAGRAPVVVDSIAAPPLDDPANRAPQQDYRRPVEASGQPNRPPGSQQSFVGAPPSQVPARAAPESAALGRINSQKPAGMLWTPNGAAPPPRSNLDVISRYESYSDEDRTLLYIAMWLKGYFADDAAVENARGVETMSESDVGELLQLYRSELVVLLEELRQRAPQNSRSATQSVMVPPAQAASQPRLPAGPSSNGTTLQPSASAGAPHPAPVALPASQQPARQEPPPVESGHSIRRPPPSEGHQPAKQPPPVPLTEGHPPPPPAKYAPPPAKKDSLSQLPRRDSGISEATGGRSGTPSQVGPPKPRPPLGESMRLMRQGGFLVKFGRNGEPLLRYFSIVNQAMKLDGEEVECPHLCWASDVKAKPSGSLPLIYLENVTRGTGPDREKLFKRDKDGRVRGLRDELVSISMCFVLTFPKRQLALYATSPEDYDMWVDGMESVMDRNRQNGSIQPPSSKDSTATTT